MSLYLGTLPIANTGYDKADTDLSNLTDDGKNIANWSNNVTNCITEIPQDIKLELNDGTLTLKAGSKVYNGNGLLHTLTEDVSLVWNYTGVFLYTYCYLSNSLGIAAGGNETVSTLPAPAQTYKLFFNTNDGKCYFDNSTTQMEECSFPIAVCTANGAISSIDQVFNGFGYIGSTVFALPGVKGLIPNGRNADGSLKNTEFTTSSILSKTYPSNVSTGTLLLNGTDIGVVSWSYDERTNYILNGSVSVPYMEAAKMVVDSNGKITSLTPKTAFHALDYNDSSTISGWSMPSDRYIDLTLGANDATYTAPANGWVCIAGTTTNGYYQVHNPNTYAISLRSGLSGGLTSMCFPVKKGQQFILRHYSITETFWFRFVYAEGENNV